MPISQNTQLFSLLGTNYGGNGTTTFALPDLRGRVPMHRSDNHPIGETGGAETVSITNNEMPPHTHALGAQNVPLGTVATPEGNTYARPASGNLFNATSPTVVAMSDQILSPFNGGSQPHNNMQPYLVVSHCIALQGIFPPRG